MMKSAKCASSAARQRASLVATCRSCKASSTQPSIQPKVWTEAREPSRSKNAATKSPANSGTSVGSSAAASVGSPDASSQSGVAAVAKVSTTPCRAASAKSAGESLS